MWVIWYIYLNLAGYLIPYFAVKLAIPIWAATIQYLFILFLFAAFKIIPKFIDII